MLSGRPAALIGALILAGSLSGCPQKRPGKTAVFQDSTGATARPSSRPAAPFAGRPKGSKPSELGVEHPLALNGHNSLASMQAELTAISNTTLKEAYELAYRLTYSTDKSKRDSNRAMQLYQQVLSQMPKFAPAMRGVGYLYVDTGFRIGPAIEWYRKAIVANPSYGLAHYGLAFLLGGTGKQTEGYQYFQQAMKCGVKDERNLRTRFFKNLNKGIATH